MHGIIARLCKRLIMFVMEYLLLIGLSFFALSIFAAHRIIRLNGKIEFTYMWSALIGSFVWEDILIFSMYFGVAGLLSYFFTSFKLFVLFFLVFWIVRSLGEALYFFLQQFIRPEHFPHNIDGHFWFLRKVLGNLSSQQCFILSQITHQMIVMLSAVGLIVLLLNW